MANRDFLLALLSEVARDPASLTRAVAAAEAATVAAGKPDAPPSDVAVTYEDGEAGRIRFPVYASETRPSVVTGEPLISYRRGEVREIEVPRGPKVKIGKAPPRPRRHPP